MIILIHVMKCEEKLYIIKEKTIYYIKLNERGIELISYSIYAIYTIQITIQIKFQQAVGFTSCNAINLSIRLNAVAFIARVFLKISF